MKPNTINPREALQAVPDSQRILFNNAAAIRGYVNDLKQKFVIHASNADAAGMWNVGNHAPAMISLIDNDLKRFGSAVAALDVLEASPEYIEAKATIEPLQAAIVALEQEEQADRERVAREHHAAQQKLADALAAAQNAPAVVAARKDAEAAAAKVASVSAK